MYTYCRIRMTVLQGAMVLGRIRGVTFEARARTGLLSS